MKRWCTILLLAVFAFFSPMTIAGADPPTNMLQIAQEGDPVTDGVFLASAMIVLGVGILFYALWLTGRVYRGPGRLRVSVVHVLYNGARALLDQPPVRWRSMAL